MIQNTLLYLSILCLLVRQYVFVTLCDLPSLCLLQCVPTLLGRFALARDPSIGMLFVTRLHYLPRFLVGLEVFHEVFVVSRGHLHKVALVGLKCVSKLTD